MPIVTSEQVARVRKGYAEGKTQVQLTAETGLARHAIYYCLDGGPPNAAGERLPKLRRRVMDAGVKRVANARAALVNRLWRAADRQVRDIETRLRLNQQQPDERERDARVLATMVKTLRELRTLDAAQTEQEPASEDEKAPENLDDFRRDLARKIDAIVARRETGTGR